MTQTPAMRQLESRIWGKLPAYSPIEVKVREDVGHYGALSEFLLVTFSTRNCSFTTLYATMKGGESVDGFLLRQESNLALITGSQARIDSR